MKASKYVVWRMRSAYLVDFLSQVKPTHRYDDRDHAHLFTLKQAQALRRSLQAEANRFYGSTVYGMDEVKPVDKPMFTVIQDGVHGGTVETTQPQLDSAKYAMWLRWQHKWNSTIAHPDGSVTVTGHGLSDMTFALPADMQDAQYQAKQNQPVTR